MGSGGMQCQWGCHPGGGWVGGCHPAGGDFLRLGWCQPQQVGSCSCFGGDLPPPGNSGRP